MAKRWWPQVTKFKRMMLYMNCNTFCWMHTIIRKKERNRHTYVHVKLEVLVKLKGMQCKEEMEMMELVEPGDGMWYAITKKLCPSVRGRASREWKTVSRPVQSLNSLHEGKTSHYYFLVSCMISPTISIVLWMWIRNWKLRRMKLYCRLSVGTKAESWREFHPVTFSQNHSLLTWGTPVFEICVLVFKPCFTNLNGVLTWFFEYKRFLRIYFE